MKHSLTLTIALLALSQFASAQSTPSLTDSIAGKNIPLTYRLKDLDETWRRVSVSGAESANAASIYRAMYGGSGSGSAYFTKGQTITVSGETYLIAYSLRAKSMDMAKIQALMMRGGQPSEPDKPTVDAALSLSLLNLRTAGSLMDIRPFNLDYEITGTDSSTGTEEERKTKEAADASAKNLRSIGAAVTAYVSERKVIPLLTDARTAQQELVLYTNDKEVFITPKTKKPYRANSALSGRKMSDYEKPERVVVFYEEAVGEDGTRGVLFLDGHVDRVVEQQWKRLKETSQIP